ncbi:MAG: hypothetical protein ACSLFN_08670 [Candidatus Limnocylindrales bacterium]
MSAWTYEGLLDAARDDLAVVGLVLTGSRGHGPKPRPGADWDVRMVVRDEALTTGRERYATPHGSVVEVVVYDLTTFLTLGLPGGFAPWDRYSYVHVPAVIDKLDGGIAALLERKGRLEADEARELAAEALDGYVNAMFRSRKNHRLGLGMEARLDAADSVGPLLTFRFAVERRVRPFNKFLGWELEQWPLSGPDWERATFLERVAGVLDTGDPILQATIFRAVEALARTSELGDVIDSWEPDVGWLRGG